MRHFAVAFVLCLGCIIIVSNLVSGFVWPSFPHAGAPVSTTGFRRKNASPPLRAAASTPDCITGVKMQWDKDDATTRFANELKLAVPEKVVDGFGLEKLVISPAPDWTKAKRRQKRLASSNLTLVTRACVRDLYDEVLRQMDVEHIPPPCTYSGDPPVLKDPPVTRAVVVGNPGIGKTMGLFHALRRLLRAGKMVTYHYAKRGLVYAFVPSRLDPAIVLSASCEENFAADGGESEVEASENYTVYKGILDVEAQSRVTKEPFCDHSDAFYLLDPHEEYGFPNLLSNTIVATSPDQERIKTYWKEENFGEYFMPMYTLDEAVRSLQNDTLGYVDEAVVKERFRVVGGNLRAIMRPEVFQKSAGKIAGKIAEKIANIRESDTVLRACMHNTTFALDKETAQTSTLFSYESEYPFTVAEAGFVSEHARTKLCDKFYEDIYKEGLTNEDEWEAACATMLTLGGIFDVRYLPYEKGAAPELVEQLIVPPSELTRRSAQLNDMWKSLPYERDAGELESILHESTNRCFALADAVLYRDVAFNPTVISSKKKLPTLPIIKDILSNIVNATKTTPLRLYHCVPEYQFEDAIWKGTAPPPYKSTWSSVEGRLLQPRLRHYALCIPRSRPRLHKALPKTKRRSQLIPLLKPSPSAPKKPRSKKTSQ